MITSPDSISQSYVPVSHGISNIHQPLWKGNVSMHSMTTFSAVAYHVSGRIEGLPEVSIINYWEAHVFCSSGIS